MKRIRHTQNHPRTGLPPLPQTANDFIYLLAVTLKPSTCRGYRTSLRKFHAFLDSQKCSLRHLTRKQLTCWFAKLHASGLSPTTRSLNITYVRGYLYWLREQGLLTANPNDLIRSTDIPRRPIYLPRPLPPEADCELQARLARSDDPLQKGLLLMRNTGIRVGELRSLAYQCIRTDLKGNSFLKVPLGKLNNERLVPLDKKTLTLVKELQAQGSVPRSSLLETCRSKRVDYNRFRQALQRAARGIEVSESRYPTNPLRPRLLSSLSQYILWSECAHCPHQQ